MTRRRNSARPGLRITTILVAMVVGVVSVVLCCCIALFLERYHSAMVQSARTSSAQAVSQVSTTVGNYLRDMDQAMNVVEQSMGENEDSRDRLLTAFLNFRPDVVAVTSYDAGGELLDCWCLGREPRQTIYQNLSFDLEMARAARGPYMTAPHVETIFEGYYPWVVTMTAPLEGSGGAAWVSLDLSFSSISSYINNVSIGQRGYCFLMDGAGNIVYHPQQQLLYAGEQTLYLEKDYSFHETIYQSQHNKYIRSTLDNLQLAIHFVRYKSMGKDDTFYEVAANSIRWHRRILQAIENRDADSAVALLVQHLDEHQTEALAK